MKVLELILRLIRILLTDGNLPVDIFIVDKAKAAHVGNVAVGSWGTDGSLIVIIEDR